MDNERILMTAFKDLAAKKTRIEKQIEELEESKDNYALSNKEFDDDFGIEASVMSFEDAVGMMSLRNVMFLAEDTKRAYENRRNEIKAILALKPANCSLEDLSAKVGNLPIPNDTDDEYGLFKKISELSKQKYIYTVDFFKDFLTDMRNASMVSSRYSMNMSQSEKEEKVREVQKYLKNALKFFDKNIEYLDKVVNASANNIGRIDARTSISSNDMLDQRRSEIRSHLKEMNNKIDAHKKSLETIDTIYALRDGFKETKDVQKFIEMIEKMKKLGVISTRDAKKVTYIKPEKVAETLVVEEVKPEIVTSEVQPQELDNDYFRRPNTECIICFLGDEKDSFVKDIMGFDNSNRKPILRTATELFEKLYSQSGFEFDATGVPNLGPGKEAKLLTYPPYKFDYKRQGTNRDKYRLHAIRRHSDLLEKLGYGKGNIIFFGAVAPTDDKNNTKLFDVVGNRCVQSLPDKGSRAILKPSLDYIEHITRGYVPKALLSLGDNVKLKSGRFIKGSEVIENLEYVAYGEVDATTQANVKKWLEDYFIEQTNTLFSIKDMYEKKKGSTLD